MNSKDWYISIDDEERMTAQRYLSSTRTCVWSTRWACLGIQTSPLNLRFLCQTRENRLILLENLSGKNNIPFRSEKKTLWVPVSVIHKGREPLVHRSFSPDQHPKSYGVCKCPSCGRIGQIVTGGTYKKHMRRHATITLSGPRQVPSNKSTKQDEKPAISKTGSTPVGRNLNETRSGPILEQWSWSSNGDLV